jgi:carboxyl-terminal processing protease
MKKRLLSLLIVTLLLLAPLSVSVQAAESSQTMTEEAFDAEHEFMGLVAKFIMDNYLYDLTYEEVIESLYRGMFHPLDDYSVYYTPEEYADFSTEMSGEFSGIGIQIVKEGQHVVVVTPLRDSPAEKAGILPRDIIRYVDGVDVTNRTTEEVANLIRGPIGTTVVLGVERNNAVTYYSLTRDLVVISSVSSEILEDGIGYLQITQFNENTAELLAGEMMTFIDEDVYKLVIDLRNNPGGNLSEVITILDLFVPAGPLAYLIRNDGSETVYHSTLSIQNYDIAVLVNEGSASASEIFAGAVQDREAGVVIGTQTYGKGVVQTLYPLLNGSAIKLTTAEYLTAGKKSVQGTGITPDIIVRNRQAQQSIDIPELDALNKSRKPDLGTVGLDVLAAERILKAMDFPIQEPDGVFDEILKQQITDFQRQSGLHPYGVLDFTTQDALIQALERYQSDDDDTDYQLNRAIDYLR